MKPPKSPDDLKSPPVTPAKHPKASSQPARPADAKVPKGISTEHAQKNS